MLGGGRRKGREEDAPAAAGVRIGAGHEEGELELEEGEALGDYGGREAGDGELVDPDALTYIDEKLQNVLGHFQKDFEGGVLAENLGSQYGGYGSFLPTYQRSPFVLSQSRSPAVPPNHGSASRSPYMPVESAQKRHFVKTTLDSRGKNDYCQRTSDGIDGNPPQRMLKRAVNGPEQKAPKIRIKVNSNRNLARNTIYSGLGLDISPSSSMDSLDGSAGAPEPKVLSDESPHTIFQIMTYHSVPGGLLLSPLAENVLELRKMSTPAAENHEACAFGDDKAELNRDWCHMNSAAQDNKDKMAEKIEYDKKKDHLLNFKTSKGRHNSTPILKKETKPELQDISDDTDSILLPRSIKTEPCSVEESTKFVAEISNHLKETKNAPLKKRISVKSSLRDIEPMVDVKKKTVDLANDDTHQKGKANSKSSSVTNAFEDWSSDSKTEPSLDHGFLGNIKYDFDGHNDRPFTASSHLQNIPPNKTSPEREKGKVMHVKDENTQYKRKEMGSLVNAEYMDIITENVGGNSSGMPKEKRISSLQTTLSGKKLKVKPHKQLNNDITRKSYGEDNRVKPEKETVTPGETDKDRPGGGNDGDRKISPMFVDQSAPMPSACKNEATESMAVPALAPVVINEEWVFCDKCEKWRLLPYGMNPDTLPQKWQCSMQSWLSGMNSCKISEDETTKALRALYMVPAPENIITLDSRHDIAMTPPTFEGNIKSITTSGKLKVGSSDAANVPHNLDMAEMSKPSKKLHAPTSRNRDGVDCFPKLKEKRKDIGLSDKGETVAKDWMHPKSKSSVGVDDDSLRESKKMKKEFTEKHHPSEFEINKSSPSTKETPKNLHKHDGISPGIGNYGSSSSAKLFHDEDKVFSDGGIRTSDVGRSDLPDLSIKNRKSKQRQLGKCGPDPLASDAFTKHVLEDALSEINGAKEKSKPELKFSMTDDHRKVAHARGPIAGIDSDGIHAEKECLSEQHKGNVHFRHSLHSESSMRRNMCFAQASTAATSSSSKVSSSHKIKADVQETRASPVESVSSSPLRTSDKILLDQHRMYSCAFAENVHSQESGKRGSSCSKEKNDIGSGSDHAKAHVPGCFNGDLHHHVLKDGDLQKDKQELSTNKCLKNEDSGLDLRNGQLNPALVQKFISQVPSIHDNSDGKQLPPHQNGKILLHSNSNQSDHAKLTSGKNPTQIKSDEGNVEHKDLKMNPFTIKGSKQQPSLNKIANGDVSYKTKQPKKAVIENMKQANPNFDDPNPINASVLLKEARDLKHLSKRLKEKGDDLESASMCFEAGLKYLHVASLLEAPNIDSSKGDSLQAMRLYSETGNLCGFCAREFERLKKMANAALAFKCVEVAYMKAAFYKQPGAIKDKHALQATSLMVPPAESPSSSASDVDNLNNQSTAAKAVSARALYSPQIAGNPIPRNNPHLVGLLAYAEDMNYAFDGHRKSQSSFSAYLADIGKDQVDGIALVREVLDFSFHNVNGLLQLIRHSLESINHESVK